jgi:hypothetical protein
MRARVEDEILYLHKDDVPEFKKKGSMVRNNYFWALRAIAAHSPYDRDWEYDMEVWVALQRLLISFAESGYLGVRETLLEFPVNNSIPDPLRIVSTWE